MIIAAEMAIIIIIMREMMIIPGERIRIADVLHVKMVLCQRNLRSWKEKISGPLTRILLPENPANKLDKTIQKNILL